MTDFKEKSTEELAGMDAQALAAYYKEKNAADRAALEAAIESKATQTDIDAMKASIVENNNKQFDAINNALKEQGLAIGRIAQGGGKPEGAKTVRDLLLDKKDALQALKAGEGRRVTLDTKVAGTMTIGGNVTGEVPQSQREAGLNRIARRMTFVSDYINSGVASSNNISWAEQVNPDGSPAGTAEGVLKNQIDFDIQVASEDVKKRTAYIKVSKEMLDDIDFMDTEIRMELMERLGLDVDLQLLTGDGVGQNLNGLITQATAFAAGSFALSIDNANNYDVLRVAANQINLANFMPNVVFVNPSDLTEMQLTKGTDGHYIKFPFVSEDGTELLGDIQIVANNGVLADTFLIMDGSKAAQFVKESMTISMGYENDDFTKNLVTMLAEWRGLLRIKGNDTLAFVSGTFTAAKAALETP